MRLGRRPVNCPVHPPTGSAMRTSAARRHFTGSVRIRTRQQLKWRWRRRRAPAAGSRRSRRPGSRAAAGAIFQIAPHAPSTSVKVFIDRSPRAPGWVAQLAPRRVARLGRGHAARGVVVGLDRQMRVELAGALFVPTATMKETGPGHLFVAQRLGRLEPRGSAAPARSSTRQRLRAPPRRSPASADRAASGRTTRRARIARPRAPRACRPPGPQPATSRPPASPCARLDAGQRPAPCECRSRSAVARLSRT